MTERQSISTCLCIVAKFMTRSAMNRPTTPNTPPLAPTTAVQGSSKAALKKLPVQEVQHKRAQQMNGKESIALAHRYFCESLSSIMCAMCWLSHIARKAADSGAAHSPWNEHGTKALHAYLQVQICPTAGQHECTHTFPQTGWPQRRRAACWTGHAESRHAETRQRTTCRQHTGSHVQQAPPAEGMMVPAPQCKRCQLAILSCMTASAQGSRVQQRAAPHLEASERIRGPYRAPHCIKKSASSSQGGVSRHHTVLCIAYAHERRPMMPCTHSTQHRHACWPLDGERPADKTYHMHANPVPQGLCAAQEQTGSMLAGHDTRLQAARMTYNGQVASRCATSSAASGEGPRRGCPGHCRPGRS